MNKVLFLAFYPFLAFPSFVSSSLLKYRILGSMWAAFIDNQILNPQALFSLSLAA